MCVCMCVYVCVYVCVCVCVCMCVCVCRREGVKNWSCHIRRESVGVEGANGVDNYSLKQH